MTSLDEKLGTPRSTDRVSLELAAEPENLRTVRLLVSAFGTRHGADMEDLEDLRVAVDEVCSTLISGAVDAGRLGVVAEILVPSGDGPPIIGLRATVRSQLPVESVDDISDLVLRAATTDFGFFGVPYDPSAEDHSGAGDADPHGRDTIVDWSISAVGGGPVLVPVASGPSELDGAEAGSQRRYGWFTRTLAGADPSREAS